MFPNSATSVYRNTTREKFSVTEIWSAGVFLPLEFVKGEGVMAVHKWIYEGGAGVAWKRVVQMNSH